MVTAGGYGVVSVDTSGGHPAMDYNEHVRTYRGFLKGLVALTVLSLASLVLMAVILL
jgi:hypothetical protein